jgi:hypothetical protein
MLGVMHIAWLIFAAMVMVAAARGAAAQTVGGAVGVSDQAAGASDLPYLGRGFGGSAVAAIATYDRDFRRRLTLGGEVSTAGAISGEQSQRSGTATNAFVSRHRDTVISATAKFAVPIGRLRAAAVGGAGGAYRRTSREGTTASIFPPASRSPFSDTLSTFVLSYTVGADVTFRITQRLSVLAVGRRHQLRDDDRLADGVVRRGVSSTIYRAGIGAQWRF